MCAIRIQEREESNKVMIVQDVRLAFLSILVVYSCSLTARMRESENVVSSIRTPRRRALFEEIRETAL